nr:Chain A, Spike glycoprotein [Human coronavirus 229E]7YI6_C Chain C, Spike glycoprotein [Human coronavirus 229E]
DVVNQQG